MTTFSKRPFVLGLLAGGTAVALAGGLMLTSTEQMLRNSFSTALTRNAPPVNKQIASAAPISGSEEFWLSAMRRDGLAPATKTISVGDQISLSIGGERRNFEVATVADFAPQVTEIDNSSGPSRFVLVTAHDTSDAKAIPVRFVMELEATHPPAVMAGRGASRALGS